MNNPERHLCVLRADVADAARVYERLGQAEAHYAIDRCTKRIERVIEGHGGRVVKCVAGEVVSIMPGPDSAMQAACDMQQRVDDLPPTSGIKLQIRVGFHSGPGKETGRDVTGEASDVVSRLVGVAQVSQILSTAPTVALLSPSLRRSARALDGSKASSAAGLSFPLMEVIWHDGGAAATATVPMMDLRRPLAGRLLIRHGGSEIVLGESRDSTSLGRDTTNDVVVMDKRASRNHARIERRRDKFVLVDLSTNGTFVTFEGELEIALKHDEVALRGRGTISFGHSHQNGRVEVAEFEVQT